MTFLCVPSQAGRRVAAGRGGRRARWGRRRARWDEEEGQLGWEEGQVGREEGGPGPAAGALGGPSSMLSISAFHVLQGRNTYCAGVHCDLSGAFLCPLGLHFHLWSKEDSQVRTFSVAGNQKTIKMGLKHKERLMVPLVGKSSWLDSAA